jgi:hypothetical protein
MNDGRREPPVPRRALQPAAVNTASRRRHPTLFPFVQIGLAGRFRLSRCLCLPSDSATAHGNGWPGAILALEL